MMFCNLFPDLFPGADGDTPIFETNPHPPNLLILSCIFVAFPRFFVPSAPRHVVDPAHLC